MLRVRAPGRVVAPTVVLYPTENESECDCPARMSPCEHVAAAAIHLSTPKEEGAAAPAERPVARVGYRFTRGEGGLRLARVLIEADGSETPLGGALASRLADPAQAARLQVEDADLRADTLLDSGGGAANRGVLPPTKLEALLRVLVSAARVQLDGVAVAISEEEILPVATLTDAGGGAAEVRLTIAADPRVRAAVAPGVVLCEDDGRGALHRLGDSDISGAWLQNLPVRRSFAAAEMGELMTIVLPDLARRTTLDVPAIDCRRSCATSLRASSSSSIRPPAASACCRRWSTARRQSRASTRASWSTCAAPFRCATCRPRAAPSSGCAPSSTCCPAAAPATTAPTRPASSRSSDAGAGIRGRRGRHRQAGGDAGAAAARHHRRRAGSGIGALRADVWRRRGTRRRGQDARRVGRRRRGRARLAGGAGHRAARPRAAGPRCRWAGWEARRARRRSAGRARGRRPPGAARAARPRALCAELEHPPPPGLDRLAPLLEGFERLPEAPLPARSDGDAARRISARGRTGSPSCATPASAACSPTTWASARRSRRCARSTRQRDARRLPDQRRVQLAGGDARASGPT